MRDMLMHSTLPVPVMQATDRLFLELYVPAGRARTTKRTRAMLLPVPGFIVREVSLTNHVSITMLESGSTEREHLEALRDAVWFSHEFMALGYGEIAREVFVRASDALTQCEQEARTTGVYRVAGPGLTDLRTVIALLDVQFGSARTYEYRDTMLKLYRAQGVTADAERKRA